MDEFFTRAVKAASDYSKSTGLDCIVINNEGFTLGPEEFSLCNGSEFCNSLRTAMPGKALDCCKVHRYGSLQAERFGGKYVFFCPMSLLHWCSPLYRNGEMAGALIGGPALIIDSDDFIRNDLVAGMDIPAGEIFSLMKLASKIPVIDTKKAASLSELLYYITAGLSELDLMELRWRREEAEQQKEISEYVQYIKNMEDAEAGNSRYPFDKESELLDCIENGETHKAKSVLNEILGNVFFSSGGDIKVIRARVYELVVLLSRAAVRGGADAGQIFGMNYRYLDRINGFRDVESIAVWLSQVLVRFSELVFDMRDIKHADAIQSAMNYIRENYSRKISLEEVAGHVSLSPSYLSKLFKKELDLNFNSYLNKVRVEKSKNYLLNTDVPLIDVAGMCGFEDQSYFSKVFRKYAEVPPGRYRETRGRIRSKNPEIHG